MTDITSQALDKALNNEQNSVLLKLSNRDISEMNATIVMGLLNYNPLKRKNAALSHTLENHLLALNGYRYVDEINDLKQNVYVKWIRNDSPNKLTKGAISCSVKITNDGMLVMCKNYFGKFFFLKMEECAIFQKITNEEKVILTVMDFIKP